MNLLRNKSSAGSIRYGSRSYVSGKILPDHLRHARCHIGVRIESTVSGTLQDIDGTMSVNDHIHAIGIRNIVIVILIFRHYHFIGQSCGLHDAGKIIRHNAL